MKGPGRPEQVVIVVAVLVLTAGAVRATTTDLPAWQENGWIVTADLAGSNAWQTYTRYYPRAEQVAFDGSAGPYNISTERYMEVSCTRNAVGLIGNVTRERLPPSLNTSFGFRTGYNSSIAVTTGNTSILPALRGAAPDEVRCIMLFHDHTYSRTINVTAEHFEIINETY